MLAHEELQKQKYQGEELQEKIDLIAEVESVVNRAVKMTEPVLDDTVSNRHKLAGIGENKSSERVKRREIEGFELAVTETQSSSKAAQTQAEGSEQSKPLQPDYLDLLRQKRQERKNGQKG